MNNSNRPLSPHLQVYKLPLTGLVSITHRMTGVMLTVGLLFVIYVLTAAATGEEAYLTMQSNMSFGLYCFIYWGFIYALFFHLCHGVRHIIWDTGKSFERDTMDLYVIIEVGCSLVLTGLVFFLI